MGGRGAWAASTGVVARRAWRDALTTVAFGVCLGLMNYVFYQAIARIPLGVAVTVEFLGPLAVAVAGSAARSTCSGWRWPPPASCCSPGPVPRT